MLTRAPLSKGGTGPFPRQNVGSRTQYIQAHASATSSVPAVARANESLSDVIALGNLCVDVILQVEELPAPDTGARQSLLSELSATPPPEETWQLGGSTNFMIAGARLGMQVGSCGHVGHDSFGHFLTKRLQDEGIPEPRALTAGERSDTAAEATLVCFVLVQRVSGRHAFCSRYDFGPWPLLPGARIDSGAAAACRHARALMINGFLFDEVPPAEVLGLVSAASFSGTAVVFDPGPRCRSLLSGHARSAVLAVMAACSVILLTEEEAQEVLRPSRHSLADNASANSFLPRRGSTSTAGPHGEAPFIVSKNPGARDTPSSTVQGPAAELCTALMRGLATRAEWAVIKLGGDGALLGRRCGKGGTIEVHAMGTFSVEVVLAFTRKWHPASALALANAVGAATATRDGAGQNVAERSSVINLLKAGMVEAGHGPTPSACKDALNRLLGLMDSEP